MFDFLKKRLKKSVEMLTKKVSGPEERPKGKKPKRPEPARERPPGKAGKALKVKKRSFLVKSFSKNNLQKQERQTNPQESQKEKRGFFGRIKEKVTERALSEGDIDELFKESEPELLQANVALEVIDFLKEDLKKRLAGRQVKRSQAGDSIRKAFEEGLLDIVDQGSLDLAEMARKKRPVTCIFLGFNGSGKTSSIAKTARFLQRNGFKPLLAAGDTFRAAAIEQIEHHGGKLGIKVIKHQYGADSAAVIYDAVRHAEAQGYDFVLADTAGRTHVNRNLADELKKVCRVNRPDLKILVVDSLTGNDAVEQAREFHEMVGVDAVVMTKVDVNTKGGSILSVCYAIKKPILFIGMGQGYDDLEMFSPGKFVKQILE